MVVTARWSDGVTLTGVELGSFLILSKIQQRKQRRATLQLVALTTLSTAAGAQLWASMLEVVTTDGGGSFSVDGFVNALSNAVSAIAGAQLAASSFGV
jgi:hypothetical protein